uniref:(northern house mosquito) hypothetical protein n=1 Tax=Culex pipiens TaxID=7175 RepID=A0A8D8E6R3_CULPI
MRCCPVLSSVCSTRTHTHPHHEKKVTLAEKKRICSCRKWTNQRGPISRGAGPGLSIPVSVFSSASSAPRPLLREDYSALFFSLLWHCCAVHGKWNVPEK